MSLSYEYLGDIVLMTLDIGISDISMCVDDINASF